MTSILVIAAAVIITSLISTAAMAACSLEDAVARSGPGSDASRARPDAVSTMMMELGELLDPGRVSEPTRAKLDPVL